MKFRNFAFDNCRKTKTLKWKCRCMQRKFNRVES